MGWFKSFVNNPLGRLSKDTATFTNAIGQVVSAPEKLIGGVGESLVKTATSLTSDLAKALVKAPNNFVNYGSSYLQKLGNGLNKAASTIVTIEKAIQKNPLPMIETIALTSFGVPYPIASAAVQAMHGKGKLESIAIAAATYYFAPSVGSYFSDQADPLLSSLNDAAKSDIKAIVASSSSAAFAASLGSNSSVKSVIQAGFTGAVGSYVGQELKAQGMDPANVNTKILNNAITSASGAILKGQDVSTAIGSSVAVTYSTQKVTEAWNAYTKNNNTIKELQTQVNSASNSFWNAASSSTVHRAELNKYTTDFKNQIGSAKINELNGYTTQINAYNKQMQDAMNNYQRVLGDVSVNGDDANGTKIQSLSTYADQAQRAKDSMDLVAEKSASLASGLGLDSQVKKLQEDEAYGRQYAAKISNLNSQLEQQLIERESNASLIGSSLIDHEAAQVGEASKDTKLIGDEAVKQYKTMFAEQQAADAKAAADAAKTAAAAKAIADIKAAADAKAYADQIAAEEAAIVKAQHDAQVAAEAKAARDAQVAAEKKAQQEAAAQAQAEAQAKAQAEAQAKAQADAAAKAQAEAQAEAQAQAQAEAQAAEFAAQQKRSQEVAAQIAAENAAHAASEKAAQEAAAQAATDAAAKDTTHELLPATKADPNTPLPTAATAPTNLGKALGSVLVGAVGTGVKAAVTPTTTPATAPVVAKPVTSVVKPITGATTTTKPTSTVTKKLVTPTLVTTPIAGLKPITPTTSTPVTSVVKPTLTTPTTTIANATPVTKPIGIVTAVAKPTTTLTPISKPTGTLTSVVKPVGKP